MNTRSIHEPIIRMTNIEKHFGSVIALAGVSVDVYPGECHCLLGDNGAGKSDVHQDNVQGFPNRRRARSFSKASRCISKIRAMRSPPG